MIHLYFQKNEQHMGTSDPDPEPRQQYEVHCGRCGWWGLKSQLATVYVAYPNCPGDVVPELGCPMCLADQFLEYEDNKTTIPDTSSLQQLTQLVAQRDAAREELEDAIDYLEWALEEERFGEDM